MAIDGQHTSSSIVAPISSVTPEQSLSSISSGCMSDTQPAHNTSGDTRPTEMDVVALRITDTDNSQALVVHSQSLLSENRVSLHSSSPLYNTIHDQPVTSSPQGHSTASTEQSIDGGAERRLLEMGSTMVQQEELRRLRQQMQQLQQQMDGIQPMVQHADQQAQDLQQQAQESQKQLQQQIDEISHKIQELYQRTQHFQQVDMTPQRLQQIDVALQEVRQLNQNVLESQQHLQVQIDEVLRKTQSLDQQTEYPQEQASSLAPEVVRGNHVPELRWLASDRLMNFLTPRSANSRFLDSL
jgi:DNA repair exonuclease SbcCD ATPase subunit